MSRLSCCARCWTQIQRCRRLQVLGALPWSHALRRLVGLPGPGNALGRQLPEVTHALSGQLGPPKGTAAPRVCPWGPRRMRLSEQAVQQRQVVLLALRGDGLACRQRRKRPSDKP